MSNLVRYLKKSVQADLLHKMVFIGGPRQVGKTTFALSFLTPKGLIESPAYLNWDDLHSKKLIKSGQLPGDEKIIILDEIHKYKGWRNLVKGFFDKQRNRHQFIVTGSARLDHYRKGGDSLLGRYHYYRLHPLSIPEVRAKTIEDVRMLMNSSGFPEPFFRQDSVFLKRWQRERHQKILFEDLRDLENVKEISLMEDLLDKIPLRVGSQLSYQSLANELEINIKTVQHWIDIFDSMYLTFRVSPIVSGKLRLVKKTHRIYLWDWSWNLNEGSLFENFVASHLLKYCHYLEDTQGDKMELKYLKDVDGREIDFIVVKNKKPLFAVECKSGERAVSPHIYYFKERLKIPHFYQVHLGTKHYLQESNIEVIPFVKFCQNVGLP